ncbi:DUF2249 domain-containing protein [Kribbella shirazensis]|uniref:Uncharacterized protein (DUF2249 family) n=1 Tax=Kribbella shirazensis TaxID=1105143 RepID=A0A7X6A3B4_9ACTN|nr:DUF2249 domain-containing protein [Kribbella shirazensis]NIK59164.1 uncharacterized protein (DUF2249 family) [Kribbella shirazensis]
MSEPVTASGQADATAAEAVEQHHAELAAALSWRREALSTAAAARRYSEADRAQLALSDWCRSELVPHALAEEETLYAAAAQRPEARLLVEAMLAEHKVIVQLVDNLAATTEVQNAAELARALEVVFTSHLAKENEQLLPLLVAAPDVSVTNLLAGMHQLIGHAQDDLQVDSRVIPHRIRHKAIFDALDRLRPGQRLVLVASHDPLPLLAQLRERAPDTYVVDYLEQGPDTWRLAFLRPKD